MTDLNEIVTYYKVCKNGTALEDGINDANKELKLLQDILSDVPVSINPTWDVSKCADQFASAGIDVFVELACPQNNTYFVNDTDLNENEIEDVIERIQEPHPFIRISGESLEKDFYKKRKKYALSKIFQPSKFGARVLQTSARNSACIIWEKDDGKLGYIELFVTSKYPL